MKKKRLTCENARKIPIGKALAFLGHLPIRNSEKEAWYLSPLRTESQASFKVSKTLNKWYDHGEGIGGNVIDLICKISRVSVQEALEVLAGLGTVSYKTFEIQHKDLGESKIQIKKIKILQHPALLQYLQQRKIDLAQAKLFCREVHYTIESKNYFAIGLKNDSGGWELRNRYCKASSSPKDIKLIKNGSLRVIVLEGMFDLFSWLTIHHHEKRQVDFLILNSVALAKKAMPIFESYETIELYLDNDDTGKKTANLFLNEKPNCSNRSEIYKGFKDLNAWLMKTK